MTISLEANPNANRSATEHLTNWLKEGSGIYTAYKTMEKTLKLAAGFFRTMGHRASVFCDRLAGKFTTFYSGLCIARIPDTTVKATKALFGADGHVSTHRNIADRIGTIADCISTWGWSGFGLFGNLGFGVIAGAADTAMESTNLGVNISDLRKTTALLAQTTDNEPVERMLKASRFHTVLKLIRTVASFALTAVAAALIPFGGSAAPAIAILAAGLGISTLSMVTYFYKETAPYKMLDCAIAV